MLRFYILGMNKVTREENLMLGFDIDAMNKVLKGSDL